MNDNERINDNSGSDQNLPPSEQHTTAAGAAPASPTDPTVALQAEGATTSAAASAAEDSAPRRRKASRPVLLGVGAGLALLLVGGVGLAVGMELGEDLDAPSSQQASGDDDRDDDEPVDDGRDEAQDREDDRGDSGQGSGEIAPAGVEALSEAAASALDATGAEGVSSVDVERGGYEVEVQFDDGTDADVFVSTDREVSEPRNGDEDASAEAVLELERLDAIADAATAAGPTADGEIVSISTSDDDAVAFEVTLRYPDGREFEAALAEDLSVVSTDLDD